MGSNIEYNVRVEFSKNRHSPEYGENAYSIESYRVLIPYGRGKRFSKSKYAIEYVMAILDDRVLEMYDSISVFTLRGGSGSGFYLKESSIKSDTNPIDKDFIDALFADLENYKSE